MSTLLLMLMLISLLLCELIFCCQNCANVQANLRLQDKDYNLNLEEICRKMFIYQSPILLLPLGLICHQLHNLHRTNAMHLSYSDLANLKPHTSFTFNEDIKKYLPKHYNIAEARFLWNINPTSIAYYLCLLYSGVITLPSNNPCFYAMSLRPPFLGGTFLSNFWTRILLNAFANSLATTVNRDQIVNTTPETHLMPSIAPQLAQQRPMQLYFTGNGGQIVSLSKLNTVKL